MIVCFSDKTAYLDRYAEPDKGWTRPDEHRWPVPYWHIDTGMAAMIMLLGAETPGWAPASSASRPSAGRRCGQAFAVPERLSPIGVVSLGYPAPDLRSPSLKRGREPMADVVAYGVVRVTVAPARAPPVAELRRHRCATIRSRSSIDANSTVILPLRRPSSTRTRVSKASDSLSASSASAGAVIRGCWRARRGFVGACPCCVQRDELLGGAHRQPLGDDAAGELVLHVRIVQAEQRPGVPGRQHAGGDPALHRHRQVEQPDRVGDLRPAAPDPVRPARRGWCRTPRATAGRRRPLPAG